MHKTGNSDGCSVFTINGDRSHMLREGEREGVQVIELTHRELEVLRWLSNGYTYTQIASSLYVGVSTIKKHVQNILKKLNANNTSHAVAISLKLGMLTSKDLILELEVED